MPNLLDLFSPEFIGEDEYRLELADCMEVMAKMPAASVDMSIYSPPFPAVFSYSSSPADMGNNEDMAGEMRLHFGFFFRSILRVIKPGRVMLVHAAQIVRMKRSGGEGLYDFRGLLIRLAVRAGFVYDYDWTIRKNPQALRNGSRILTPRGWVPIESLVIGSRVIGANGNETQVTGVHPQGVRKIFRVKTSDGQSVDCDGRHLWTIMTTQGINVGKAKTLTTEYMASHGLFMPSGEPRFYLPILSNPARFDSANLPMDPYLLGVLLGDGMLSSRGTVGVCTQRGIVENLSLPLGHTARMLPGSEKGSDVCSWHILGNEWHRNDVLTAIRHLGLDGCRAWEKFIPQQYLFSDTESRRLLLAGLIDTDGGNKIKGGIKYHATSLQLAEDFRFLVESLGGICTLIRRTGGAYSHKGEGKIGRDIYELTPRLRDGICPFRLKSKADAWKEPIKGMRRAIVSIEAAGEAPCTCITVNADDGLFVTEGCIITHNSQAIRNKSWALKFQGIETDRAQCRGSVSDYLIKFRAPGENAVPVVGEGQVTRNDWIKWAEPCWGDVKETRTLNYRAGKDKESDTKHICPLQLDVIERGIKLYTNPGEIVFSPFAGVGSEGFCALKLDRRFYGSEMKETYHTQAVVELNRAIRERNADRTDLFSGAMA